MDITRLIIAFFVSTFFFFYFNVVSALISTHTKCPECGKLMHTNFLNKETLDNDYICTFCKNNK